MPVSTPTGPTATLRPVMNFRDRRSEQMNGIVCVLCMLMCFSGCASDRKKTAWERQYETLQEQGYGFGNEANAKSYRDKIRGD